MVRGADQDGVSDCNTQIFLLTFRCLGDKITDKFIAKAVTKTAETVRPSESLRLVRAGSMLRAGRRSGPNAYPFRADRANVFQ